MRNSEKELQKIFISLVKEKISKRLASTLADILEIEKEAVYRRLRNEVSFSFAEIASLSSYLGISLDQIANVVSPFRSQSYQLHVRNYDEFKPIDLNMSLSYIKALNIMADSTYSEYAVAANTLPLHISLLHFPLYRVYLLKWRYQIGTTPKHQLSYSNTQVPDEEVYTYAPYLEAVKKIKHTSFIWDSSFLLSLINDINYFYNIRMIKHDELCMLKKEVASMLDTLEYYADYGKFETTGNEVKTYVSNLNFETTYSYFSSDNMFISMSNAYSLGAFTSLEKEACDEMKKWILGLKKSSILISGVALQDKIKFFDSQRKILDMNLL